MSLLFRCLPSATRLPSAHGRVRYLVSINQTIRQPIRQPIVPLSALSRNFSGYGDEYDLEDQMDDRMDEEDEQQAEMYPEEEEELDSEKAMKEARRQDKGSKQERLKKIEKEKRRQKMLLRARIDKLENVKPGGKPKRLEDNWEPEPSDYDVLDVDNKYGPPELDDLPDDSNAPLREQSARQVESDEQPVNDQIKGDVLMLIGPDGKKIGLVARDAALTKVRSSGLDLVQLSPAGVTPPVCKVVKYREWVKAEALKRGATDAGSKNRKMKHLMIRPTIAPNDLQTKMNHAKRFLRDGHPVKITYLALDPKAEEWIPFFEGISKHLAGIGKGEDNPSKPYTVYNLVHNKQSRKKSEKQNKDKDSSHSAAESQSVNQTEAAEIKI